MLRSTLRHIVNGVKQSQGCKYTRTNATNSRVETKASDGDSNPKNPVDAGKLLEICKWKEETASHSEAIVKADRHSKENQTIVELQEQSVKLITQHEKKTKDGKRT